MATRPAALLLEFLVEYGQTLLTTYLGQRVMYDLRMQIFTHLQRLSIPFFDRTPVGRLITRVTSDVEALNELFTAGVVMTTSVIFGFAQLLHAGGNGLVALREGGGKGAGGGARHHVRRVRELARLADTAGAVVVGRHPVGHRRRAHAVDEDAVATPLLGRRAREPADGLAAAVDDFVKRARG